MDPGEEEAILARHCTAAACPEIIRVHGAAPWHMERCRRGNYHRHMALGGRRLLASFQICLASCGGAVRFSSAYACDIFTKPWQQSRFFCALLELLGFPRDRRPPCGICSKPRRQSRLFLPTPRVVGFSSRQVATVRDFHHGASLCIFVYSLSSCFFRGLTRVVFSQTARVFFAQRRNLHSSQVDGNESLSLTLGKSKQRRLRVGTCQALGLCSAWPIWPLPRQGLYAPST